jgi:hypothetical protein
MGWEWPLPPPVIDVSNNEDRVTAGVHLHLLMVFCQMAEKDLDEFAGNYFP